MITICLFHCFFLQHFLITYFVLSNIFFFSLLFFSLVYNFLYYVCSMAVDVENFLLIITFFALFLTISEQQSDELASELRVGTMHIICHWIPLCRKIATIWHSLISAKCLWRLNSGCEQSRGRSWIVHFSSGNTDVYKMGS